MLTRLKRYAFDYLSKTIHKRMPTKESAFAKLNEINVPVNTVIDVGVLESTPALISQFSKAHHILCEPVSEFRDRIHAAYSGNVRSYELYEAAIGAELGEIVLQTSSVTARQGITHSKIIDDTQENESKTQRRVPLRTVDDIVNSTEAKGPYLLKVDIDGRDLDVIAGAKSTLQQCSVVCIEAGVKNIHQRLPAILAQGFQLFDIVDICYYEGRLIQVDLIFVKKSILKDLGCDFTDTDFDVELWNAYLG